MPDLIGTLILGIQYSLIFLIGTVFLGSAFPREFAIFIFPVFAGVSIAIWRNIEKSAQAWGAAALSSVVIGLGFFGIDWFNGFLQKTSDPLYGGFLGVPLTILVCPIATIVCVAALGRQLYINRMGSGTIGERGPRNLIQR